MVCSTLTILLEPVDSQLLHFGKVFAASLRFFGLVLPATAALQNVMIKPFHYVGRFFVLGDFCVFFSIVLLLAARLVGLPFNLSLLQRNGEMIPQGASNVFATHIGNRI